jgi:hypothetical protein
MGINLVEMNSLNGYELGLGLDLNPNWLDARYWVGLALTGRMRVVRRGHSQ